MSKDKGLDGIIYLWKLFCNHPANYKTQAKRLNIMGSEDVICNLLQQ
jgi:hypothetical protein